MKRRAKRSRIPSYDASADLTLGDHLRELQGRLFSTVFVFIIMAAAAYPFFDKIAEWLMAPLREDQELVYLTPGGAFSFIIKVCVYVGLIGTLPMIIYHIYKFIMPAVQVVKLRTVLSFTIWSILLAVSGILFAYYVSLPAALYFLTGFELNHINPMLTIDAYFSFIMTYMLAGAMLFQVPLLMLIINSVTPKKPGQLMKAQRYIILGSFVIAAIISPTPDALNQTLLAAPLIVMYQVGIFLVWRVNARAAKRARKAMNAQEAHAASEVNSPVQAEEQPIPVPIISDFARSTIEQPRPVRRPAVTPARPALPQRSIDVMGAARAMDIRGGARTHTGRAATPDRTRHLPPVRGTIDGMVRA